MSGRTNNISSYFNITNYISTTHYNVGDLSSGCLIYDGECFSST